LEINKARRHDAGGKTYWTVGPSSGGATRDCLAHLLPVYDEYIVAYRDREAVPHGPSKVALGASTGESVTFQHSFVVSGQVIGTWRRRQSATACAIDVFPMRRMTRPERQALEQAAARYERFLSTPLQLSVR
jgi:hypothetical protein